MSEGTSTTSTTNTQQQEFLIDTATTQDIINHLKLIKEDGDVLIKLKFTGQSLKKVPNVKELTDLGLSYDAAKDLLSLNNAQPSAQPTAPQQHSLSVNEVNYRYISKQKIVPTDIYVATSPPKDPPNSKWGYVDHPQRAEILGVIKDNGSRKVIKGRRRIGKSTLLKSICQELQADGTPILFIVCHSNITDTLSSLQIALHSIEFSQPVQLPHNPKSLAQYLNYLIRCGVSLVLDEFQRLTSINGFFEHLQEEFDHYPNLVGSDMGVFTAMGSHIQDLESIFTSKEPLFQRNFRFYLMKPFTPTTIYSQLKDVITNINFETFLSLYTFGDGIIGSYRSMYSGGYLSGTDSIQSIISYLNTVEVDYSKELRPICTKVLEIVSDSKPAQLETNITKMLKENGVDNIATKFLDDLVSSDFIVRLPPIMDLKDTTPKYKIIDFPYRVIQCIANNTQQTRENIQQLEGVVIEDICRYIIPQYLIKQNLIGGNLHVCDGFWNGAAEIDFFAFDDNNIYLASCKRDPSRQNPLNLLTHWICYLIEKNGHFMINNKSFETFNYHFLFCSPTFSKDLATRFEDPLKYYPDFCKFQDNLESLLVNQYNFIFHKIINSFQQFNFSSEEVNSFIKDKLGNNINKIKKKDFPKQFPAIQLHALSLEDFFNNKTNK